ncbi:hypothetical protein SOP85_22475 [Pseudomonas sp. YuFO20]|jgi:hypothetical protein|uniref:Uncharacterized protein n=1 Tax=Pseudomonas neuropathica TaxID=2730425 RepID=A0ACC7N1A1_9PSED|nr:MULTISPECIES: hypothetical protein [Pseudomonas]MDD2103726.1 hypothetical protein [Pseudomonas putida]MEB2518169.1 hypothetical protein [Pseudomonas sp. YuFO20]MEB2624439.1 hypothetical protein [Pseudomonas sp. YuFO8]
MTSGFLGFNGKKARRTKRPRVIIASATDLAMLGLLFIYTSSKGGRGETAQFVPSSFMDTLYSDAIRCLRVNDIVLRIIE